MTNKKFINEHIIYGEDNLPFLNEHFRIAQDIWYEEWIEGGSKDEGSCTGGKGVRIWFKKRRWKYERIETFSIAPPCQGNVSASQSSSGAIKYLKDQGIDCWYYDGWMD